MKMKEINQRFTELVTNYISKGYVIHVKSMAGSQGEIGKVDLVKGNELIRVWLNSESRYEGWDDPNKFYGNVIVLRVGVWKFPAIEAGQFRTVWMSELDTILEDTYYQVDRHGQWFVSSENMAVFYNQIRSARHSNKRVHEKSYDITDKSLEIACSYMKRKVGYKRISYDKIKVVRVTMDNTPAKYVISYNGINYKLV